MELKPKQTKAPQTKKTQPKKPLPKKPAIKPKKPKPTKKPEEKKKPIAIKKPVPSKIKPEKVKPPQKPKIDEEKLQAERERLAENKRLKAAADALAQQQQQVKLEHDQQQVQSHSQQIRADIENKWSRPPSARNGMEVTLIIQLVPSGDLIDVQVLKRSGNDAFDNSAINAVRKVQTFNVPEEYELFDREFRRITMSFRAEGLTR